MTTYIAIDAGLAFQLIVPGPQLHRVTDMFKVWQTQGIALCAPTLWFYELASALTKMVHFGTLAEADAAGYLLLAGNLDVELIAPTPQMARRAFDWTRRLRRAAAYDSFYLALAEEIGCEFWTMDKRLVNAAGEPWVRFAGVDAT